VRDRQALLDALEVRVHLARRPVPVGRILGQRPQDDEVELVRHLVHLGRPLRRRRRRHGVQVLHRDLERRVARERHRSRQHLVEHDSDRVEVG
jgi:hypothetical protein